jgi:hypothetical protein
LPFLEKYIPAAGLACRVKILAVRFIRNDISKITGGKTASSEMFNIY